MNHCGIEAEGIDLMGIGFLDHIQEEDMSRILRVCGYPEATAEGM